MKQFKKRLLEFNYAVFGFILLIISMILSFGFNVRLNFLNLIVLFLFLLQGFIFLYKGLKSGEIKIREIVYPIVIVGSLYGLFVLVCYLTYKFR